MKMQARLRSAAAMMILALAIVGIVRPADAATSFAGFLAGLWPDAAALGISHATFDSALQGITPDPSVIKLAGTQPEFNQTPWGYIASRVTPGRVAEGRQLAAQWKSWLDRIEQTYGVDRYSVLAVWGLESNFGTGSGGQSIVRSLATLACCTTRRPDYFRSELLDALVILQKGDITPGAMTGSWAGAMGQTQFMPSSFATYAVDADGDGRRDIWTSVPDALASTANYLSQHDWDPMRRWGYEVTLPKDFNYTAITSLDGKPVADWTALGIRRTDGGAFDDQNAAASLLLIAGAQGPAFLTLKNYWAIKTYNTSDSYVLSVGKLADRIRGEGGIVHPWPTAGKPLTLAQREAMQRRLAALGYPMAKIDGKIGPDTRTAIRAWQASAGFTADGYPTPAQLQRMGAIK